MTIKEALECFKKNSACVDEPPENCNKWKKCERCPYYTNGKEIRLAGEVMVEYFENVEVIK